MSLTIKQLAQEVLLAAARAGKGHIPSALSILTTVNTLYRDVMTADDTFVLSKGHGCLALYVVLADHKIIPWSYLAEIGAAHSPLGGHPTNNVPGIAASTGSLGHGFPFALGLALGRKLSAKPGRVFCLVGDGECDEGSIWETASLASVFGLTNLVCLVDSNHSSPLTGGLRDVLADRFEAFGWLTEEVPDEASNIRGALTRKVACPYAVIVSTKKGCGIKAMENNPARWHHRVPAPDVLGAMLEELA